MLHSHSYRKLIRAAALFLTVVLLAVPKPGGLQVHFAESLEVEAAEGYYRVATSFKANAITKGIYKTFEEARKAATVSQKWYVFDKNGQVLFPRYMRRADQIYRVCAYLKAIAADNRHGFGLDPVYRLTGKYPNCTYPPFTPFKNAAAIRAYCQGFGENGSVNCSTAPILAYTLSGYSDLIGNGASGAGNIIQVCLKNGFADVTSRVNLRTGKGLEMGDILVYIPRKSKNAPYPHSHCTLYLGGGKLFWASSDNDGRLGDNTGTEVEIRDYANRAWQTVLRPIWKKDGSSYRPNMVYDGINYKPVYNYNYYLKTHPAVEERYHGEQMMTLRHFVLYGMPAGWQGSRTFNLSVFKKYNPDVVKRYGNDKKANPMYYKYWCTWGYAHEKRRTY